MEAISLSENVVNRLELIEGKSIDEKITNLLHTNTLLKLKECEECIFKYEAEYGMDFKEFSKAWENGEIKNKYSHSVERDFMEWEGMEIERKNLLHMLRNK